MNEVLADKILFYSKRWFARLSLAIAILLTVPTVAIMATWNTLPGEKLYPVKRYLEDIALKIVGNSFSVRADLQTQFVEQRFNESEALLSQSSDAGLADLVRQIQATKTDIITARAKVGTKDAVSATKKAEKLSAQLKTYNTKLQATEQSVTSQIQSSPSRSLTPPEVIAQQATVVKVEQTRQEITKVIGELESATTSPDSSKDNKKDDKPKGESIKDQKTEEQKQDQHLGK